MISTTDFDNGFDCVKIGKSIHYNPFRNTKPEEDKEENAYENWNKGWNKYHQEKDIACKESS